MAKTFNIYNDEKNTQSITITINGVVTKMSYKEYLKYKRDKAKAKKKVVMAQHTEIKLLPSHIKALMNSIKVLRSLAAYYDNGYKQWGVVARNIIDNSLIRKPFVQFRSASYEIADLREQIKDIAKKNDKDVFQFVEKLSYKIDDVKHHLHSLVRAVEKSRVCDFYADKECINGEGRRLGLRVLMMRSLQSLNEIDNVFNELNTISEKGIDVLDYTSKGKRITEK